MEQAGLDRSAHYVVRVEGVRDSAALHGLLAKVRDLGLPLLEVRRVHQGRRQRR
jgi:hypothetical protein